VHFRNYGTQTPGTCRVEECKTVAFETFLSEAFEVRNKQDIVLYESLQGFVIR